MAADNLDNLPADETVPTHGEIQILDNLFKQNPTVLDRIKNESSDLVLLLILFVFFSLPIVDEMLKKFVTITNSSMYILVFLKGILFAVCYYFIKNMYLVRKK